MNVTKLIYGAVSVAVNGLSYLSPRRAGRLAFRMFGTPPPVNLRQKEREFLATARRLDRPFRGKNIAVYEWGAADDPIVFTAYGWGYNAGRWRHFVPPLVEAGYRVIAFDPPGHGNSPGRLLHYPLFVDLERELIESLGGIDLLLGHSFGGGTMVETLASLPLPLRPRRICLMAIFSEVRWIFEGYARAMRLRPNVLPAMEDYIVELTGRRLDEFDVAKNGATLGDLPTLLVHDPEDKTTSFRNARRIHSHWPNSYLYAPRGAGHHLGTAEVTRNVIAFLLEGAVPAGAEVNEGQLTPIPAIAERQDKSALGVTNYYD